MTSQLTSASPPVVISLTTFIGYVAATGRGKTTAVTRARAQYDQGYAKEKDFWLPLRHAIMAAHERDGVLVSLDDLKGSVSPSKAASYTEAIAGYKRWVGKRQLRSRGQRHYDWRHGDLVVKVNPELDVDLNDARTLVKLYFNKDALSRTRLDLALHVLRVTTPRGARAAIVDVRRAKIYAADVAHDSVMATLLEIEADGLVRLWRTMP